jgi:2-polyprenyl-3-methyl-5-hydroxy-6-metoxy-1,4-benzoquinol methylase
MTAENQEKESLLDREARFWDEQEEAIDDLYAKPHDWRFIPEIADYVIKPKVQALMRIIGEHREKIHTILDIGCGNGWFCHSCADNGIKAYGVDISSKKVEAAKVAAVERGIGELCHFKASDIMELELPEKVDMITAHGSLHHLPDLEDKLPILIERFLKPDGLMLFVEPHHEGMSPGIQKLVFNCANSRLMGNWFDKEHYVRVRGEDGSGPAPAEEAVIAPADLTEAE